MIAVVIDDGKEAGVAGSSPVGSSGRKWRQIRKERARPGVKRRTREIAMMWCCTTALLLLAEF
jgi:hypothetical protein